MKDAVWNVGVTVWLTAGSVMVQPHKVCVWPSWWVPQPCREQDAGAAFIPTQPC